MACGYVYLRGEDIIRIPARSVGVDWLLGQLSSAISGRTSSLASSAHDLELCSPCI